MATRQDEAYQYALAKVREAYKDIPDGDRLLEKIVASFEKHFKNPPIRDFEVILQKNFTMEEIRCAMFKPTDEQIRYYPMVLHVTQNLPENHTSEERTRSIVLSLIYLVHRKSWSFLEEFILHGGLGVIASMTGDANLYYRGQAFEILLSITDNDSFDWFQPQDGSTTQKILHERLLGLSKNSNFLSGLIENRKNSYPGGSFQALQLMGFWLSWVRALMTKDQVLNLSDKIIHELYLWSEGDDKELLEEEKALAKAIFQDFSYDQFHKDQPSGSGSIDMGKFLVENCIPTYSHEIGDDSELNEEKGGQSGRKGFNPEEKSLLYVSGFQSLEKGVELPTLPSAVEIAKILLARKSCNELSNNVANTSASHNVESADSCSKNKSNFRNVMDSNITTHCTKSSFDDISHHSVFSFDESSSSLGQKFVAKDSTEFYPEISDEDALAKAQATKTQGNELFKISKYDDALIIYKESLLHLESLDAKIARVSADGNERLIINDKMKSFVDDILILKVSLHFNCATVHWKLSEFRNHSNDNKNCSSNGNDFHRELQYCESACLAALNLNPIHCKSVYRLSEVMLILNRPKEALILIEKFSNNSNTPVDETIKSIRRRCLSAVLTISPTSMRGSAGASNTTSCGGSSDTSLGNSRSNSTSYGNSSACSSAESDDGFESSAIEDSMVLEPAKLGQYVQPHWSSTVAKGEGRAQVEVHAEAKKVDITTATIGSQAAKHLKALQIRASREKSCSTHAWNGWVAPIEEKEGLKVVEVVYNEVDNLVDDKSEDEEDREEESMYSENTGSVTIAAIRSATPVAVVEDANEKIKKKIIEFPADEASIQGKSEVDSVVFKQRVKGAKKAERLALELEGKGKKGKGRGGEQGGKSKPEKVTKLPNKSVIAGQASDHYNDLKNVSILFTKSFNCASAITKTDVIVGISELEINSVKPLFPNGEVSETVKCNNTVLEGLYDQMDTYVETAIKILKSIWDEGINLKKLTKVDVEEDFFHFLLTIAIKCCDKKNVNSAENLSLINDNVKFSIKLLHQMCNLERFQTIFHLTLYGNENLESSLVRTIDFLSITIDNEMKKLSSTSMLNIDNHLPIDSKEKRKIQINLEKMKESISKISALLTFNHVDNVRGGN